MTIALKQMWYGGLLRALPYRRATITTKTPEAWQEVLRKSAMTQKMGGFDSGYEKRVWDFCERSDIPISNGPIINFEYQGKAYRTHIDFQVDDKLFEA